MALIEFEHIRKAYPGSASAAVEDLDLAIEAGEFLTLLGPSGSGKTTTLMLLAGFEAPSAGHIRLNGQPIEALPPHRRDMGVVFQSYSLFPHMSVAENVAFPLSVRKRPRAEIEQRVAKALRTVRLDHLAQRKPSQLSGGQQQRVALARAMVFEPKLILMDEPLSALDKKLREEMQLEIRRLHRELGVTMVFVTHDQAEAMTLSDRVAVFNHGRIEQLAGPQTLYDAPANPFVAGFIGDNNRIDGQPEGATTADTGVSTTAQVRAGALQLVGRRAAPAAAPAGAVATSSSSRYGATLTVRPESLRLAADRAGLATDNRLDATLLDLIHQGDHWRAVLKPELPGTEADRAPPWTAKLAPGALPAALQPGQRVALGFDSRDAWVFA